MLHHQWEHLLEIQEIQIEMLDRYQQRRPSPEWAMVQASDRCISMLRKRRRCSTGAWPKWV